MKLTVERNEPEFLRHKVGPSGSEVTFVVRARADAWARERVRILARNSSEVFRNAVESMVVGWEGVEDDNGQPRGFAWEYLLALAELPGFDGAISELAAFVLSSTNVSRDTERGAQVKKTPDES